MPGKHNCSDALSQRAGKSPKSTQPSRRTLGGKRSCRQEREVAIQREDRTIAKALAILESRARQPGILLTHSEVAGDWFRLRMAEYPVEVFAVAWLDARHRLIAFCELFRGTVDRVSVPLRELLRSAIAHNAVAALLAHNHPSGATEPSRDDIDLTADAAAALRLVGVRLLDHFVVAAGQATVSLAQRGCVPTALASRRSLAARRGQARNPLATYILGCPSVVTGSTAALMCGAYKPPQEFSISTQLTENASEISGLSLPAGDVLHYSAGFAVPVAGGGPDSSRRNHSPRTGASLTGRDLEARFRGGVHLRCRYTTIPRA